jgi:hypothetical protein
MAMVVTKIDLVSEDADRVEADDGTIQYDDGTRYVRAMSPRQIIDALIQLDPDDLADVQRMLYDVCYEKGGVLVDDFDPEQYAARSNALRGIN